MISISLCMIVKNEEKVLARCLDSLKDLMDEIIIVDTGSTDRTKEIAGKYTDKIYDFKWIDDFSAARNFSFSKASKDYIYAPDADEVLNESNRKKFLTLKAAMLPEIEIVTMKYITPSEFNTVQNEAYDVRPKLFKRVRNFTWINPVHETIQLSPVIYDSDIEIEHLPHDMHCKRDFRIFLNIINEKGILPEKLLTMYTKELLKCGDEEDFKAAAPYYEKIYSNTVSEEATCVLARYYRITGDSDHMFSVALGNVATAACSEICCELGAYYLSKADYSNAAVWYYNAAYEVKPVLDIETGGIIPLKALSECYNEWAALENSKSNKDSKFIEALQSKANEYKIKTSEWKMPEFD